MPTTLSPADLTPADLGPGSPARLGAHIVPGGVDFAVFSANAAKLEVCLFEPGGSEQVRLPLPERTGAIWHGHVPGIGAGQLYGLRAHGAYQPERGARFNPNKLLVDPYATRLAGRVTEAEALYGYDRRHATRDLSFDARDSAPFVPKAVVIGTDDTGARARPPRPRHRWDQTVIYEAHLKGLTATMPGVPSGVAGTWEALGHDRVIAHLERLGITALELLPVHAMIDDAFLIEKNLANYWGYNTLSYFAPAKRYLGPAGEAGIIAAVDRLHEAGIEVILDVVYNHTAEGGAIGPTLSFRGLDNASYYRLMPGDQRRYVDDTGCGNTLNLANPFVLRLVMDSLRHWVTHYGIDGFRFDLATTLAREPGGFDPTGGFLDALMQDPVLADVKLIMEPWDIGPGGYQLGNWPAGTAEWNDRFRDDVRRFWRGDAGTAPSLAPRLLGSADIFERGGRPPFSSINFVTAHDGFTLADLTAYATKHNEANGEGNRDGHGENLSDNHGHEGPTDDAAIRAARAQRRRNLMATLMFSQGTPMLLAGDEVTNSQGGNNNAYCQDNSTGWITWPDEQPFAEERREADRAEALAMLAFAARLIRLRRAHPVLRQTRFLHGHVRAADGCPDVEWLGALDGAPRWDDPGLDVIGLHLRGAAEAPASTAEASDEDDVVIAINRGALPVTFRLPAAPHGLAWWCELDTADPGSPATAASRTTEGLRSLPEGRDGSRRPAFPVTLQGRSLALFAPRQAAE
ncbi:MAG: glycogen debranching protein GlgX [Pseudomonadota bacterium]